MVMMHAWGQVIVGFDQSLNFATLILYADKQKKTQMTQDASVLQKEEAQ